MEVSSVAHLKLAPFKCLGFANRRDVAIELRRPLALVPRNTLALCPGSRHLPATHLEEMEQRSLTSCT